MFLEIKSKYLVPPCSNSLKPSYCSPGQAVDLIPVPLLLVHRVPSVLRDFRLVLPQFHQSTFC